MSALLSRLDGVREVGRGRWRARCPAHGSKGGTLSVREESDGRTLVYCFAGCTVSEIVGAVGLELTALFPEKRLADRIAPAGLPRAEVADYAGTMHADALRLACIAAAHQDGKVDFTAAETGLIFEIAGRASYIERRLRGRC